jgi:sugar/nucleoside kinase (ribokinase family)
VTTVGPDVVVIGDALLDVTARPASPIRPGEDVPAAVRIGPGGQGANLAVRLARRGARVELLCALGDDPAGTLVREALGREGVGLSVVESDATGTVVILLDQRGERTMLSQRAPFAAEAASGLRADVAWLVVSGYLLLEAGADELARALARGPARRALVGCSVSDARSDDWARAAAAMRPDLVVLNRDEARTLIRGTSDADELSSRLGERLQSGVVVTEPDGATARLNGLGAAVRAPTDASTVDSTGAGDAFAAALIDSLRRSPWPPAAGAVEAALAAASELATAVAQAPGAQGRVAGEPNDGLRQ